MLCCCLLSRLFPSVVARSCSVSSLLSTIATSASFHGVVCLQNGSGYQIDKKNFLRYDGFIATPEIGDIRVNVFTSGANTASAEDGIYLLDARITIDPIIEADHASLSAPEHIPDYLAMLTHPGVSAHDRLDL
ncbi:hypothetical protein DFJ58DRAFT_135776 [Suillus subalutaceus]|uniref:uncharacterized protein n=1 Tax=Suillus subalutaceus TaxID=48586 RepID=UPI001B87BBD5|nr:uncharacterized protein DFJ58DRAFT_135776 [Suillus subalutaceus]KAG1837931.1 hypothetical protein DFJ58DRAFT_135776 [Suillus subalutaceus]